MTQKPEVVIVDYGVGNLFNVQRAFKILGVPSVISCNPDEIQSARRLLLPGVGAFVTGMQYLEKFNLTEAIGAFAASGRPLLGICLGMQLLMTSSEEGGHSDGLNLVKGRVIRFAESNGAGFFKIPQIGWNALQTGSGQRWKGTILEDLEPNPHMYFVHSYCVYPEDPSCRLATTAYGRDVFCSVLQKGSIFGCQFHPERSGEQGLKILQNFVNVRT